MRNVDGLLLVGAFGLGLLAALLIVRRRSMQIARPIGPQPQAALPSPIYENEEAWDVIRGDDGRIMRLVIHRKVIGTDA